MDSSQGIEIRRLQRPDGLLRPYLLSSGFPLILPSLWIDELGLSARPNTLEAYLRDVALLYRWGAGKNISIEGRLRTLRGFSAPEIRGIALVLCRTNAGKAASQSTCLRRLESIKSFLDFGFDYFIETAGVTLAEQAQAEKNKAKQIRRFAKQIGHAANEGTHVTPSTDLSLAEVEVIDAVLHPASELNPFQGESIRMRNYCMFHVLLETLARRSELVLLEISDVELGYKPTLRIKEASISARSKRRDGANLKTLGREVPISSHLAQLLHHYIDEVRGEFLWPRRPSTALFLSDRDGRRLSAYSVNQILRKLQDVPEVIALAKRIHPHGLRSTAANRARRKLTQAGRSSGVDVQESLSYLGGWVPNSPMVQRYTRAAISERLGEILRDQMTREKEGG